MSEAARSLPVKTDSTMKPQTFAAKAYAAASPTAPLAPFTFVRRAPRPQDVQIEILYCGVCHSDLHQTRNEWKDVMPTVYPCVPGHEIVGRVAKVGSAVTKFKAGDLAAVGCLVDTDGTCPECKAGMEQFCPNPTLTYNFPDKRSGGVTYGGYSDSIVVTERFVLKVPTTTVVGVPTFVTVVAVDATGNWVPNYTGIVALTTTDGAALLPARYAFTAADKGLHVFEVTFKTAGPQKLAATDGSLVSSAAIMVSAA